MSGREISGDDVVVVGIQVWEEVVVDGIGRIEDEVVLFVALRRLLVRRDINS